MSSDTDRHRELIGSLEAAVGKGDGSFERAVVQAFQHVFGHLERLNAHVSPVGPAGEDRPLKPGESSTLR